MTPDPEFLFMTPSHQEALAGVTYAIVDRQGFAVLTGEAGTGKTTILSSIIGSLHGSTAYFAWILNPLLTTSELFELALLDFGLTDIPSSKALRITEFQKFLLSANQENKTCVLIIDEAHNLTPPLLEEIWLLTNFESSRGKLLQIILAGQAELDAILERHDLRQLKQRISVRLTVDPLRDVTEVGNYIAHRWKKAGGTQDPPFESGSVRAITDLSKGVPRVINALCDKTLLWAFADSTRSVDLKIVHAVAADLRLLSKTAGAVSAAAVSGPAVFSPAAFSPDPLEIPRAAEDLRADDLRAGEDVPHVNGSALKTPFPTRWAERFGFRSKPKSSGVKPV
jgi:general secretion pathway protein A